MVDGVEGGVRIVDVSKTKNDLLMGCVATILVAIVAVFLIPSWLTVIAAWCAGALVSGSINRLAFGMRKLPEYDEPEVEPFV